MNVICRPRLRRVLHRYSVRRVGPNTASSSKTPQETHKPDSEFPLLLFISCEIVMGMFWDLYIPSIPNLQNIPLEGLIELTVRLVLLHHFDSAIVAFTRLDM